MINDSDVYDGKINLNVENNSHTKAFYQIYDETKGNGDILEVGCSRGYFGKVLEEIGYTVWCVEPSPVFSEEAKNNVRYVFQGTVEEFFLENRKQQFEHIVFGDVLEHLYQPEKVLIECRSRLVDKGSVICSIPNVTHLAIRVMLMNGEWEYGDEGILDKTHVRFFSRKTVAKLFSDAGLAIVDIQFVRLSAKQVGKICGIELDDKLLVKVSELIDDDNADVFQFVVKAIPCDMQIDALKEKNDRFVEKDRKKILCIIPFHGSTLIDVRLLRPLRRWASLFNGEVRVVLFSELLLTYRGLKNYLGWADIVICLRDLDSYSSRLIEYVQDSGIPLIYDMDDLLTDVPKFLSTHKGAMNNIRYLESCLRRADMVSTTTKRLAKEINKYNKQICIVPNGVQYAPPPDPAKHDDKIVKLIIASSDTVRLEFIVDAINKVISTAKEKIKIITIGPPGGYLSSRIKHKIDKLQNMPYQEFREYLEGINNAIGIIPLDDSVFSSCKSPIKYLDYGICGIPVICSNVLPYKDIVENMKTGVLVNNTAEDWSEAILLLVKSSLLRNSICENTWNFVNREFSYDNSAREWQSVFNKVEVLKSKTHTNGNNATMLKYYHFKFVLIVKRLLQIVKEDGIIVAMTKIYRYIF